jgi:hypothetical protein
LAAALTGFISVIKSSPRNSHSLMDGTGFSARGDEAAWRRCEPVTDSANPNTQIEPVRQAFAPCAQ